MAQKVYIIENLDCANCAAKIEQKINQLPQVEAATLSRWGRARFSRFWTL